VFDVDKVKGGLVLVEVAKGVTVDTVRKNTAVPFEVAATLGEFA